MLSDIEKSILSTIVYYDVLGMPLTAFEAWKYLINSEQRTANSKHDSCVPTVSFIDILGALDKSELLGKFIDSKNGLYFLKGRDNLYQQRIERKKIADQKWKKVCRIARWFQAAPFIRMIAVSGSLAQNNTKLESDLDLLIVTKNGRIWTARALVTFLTALMGVRRSGEKTKNRICLNHYITDESLKIKFRSLYNAQTYAHLVCIEADSSLDKTRDKRGPSAQIYTDFQRANSWIKDYLNFYPIAQNQNQRFIKPNSLFKLKAKFWEFLLRSRVGDRVEKFLKNIQLAHIEKHPLRHKKGGRVVADDLQLEFHPESPERGVLDKYNKKMIDLGFSELGREKNSGLF